MSETAFLEVVQDEEGDIILRRADSSEGSAEPLLAMHFSDEVKELLGEHLGVVANAMIAAGMQTAGQLRMKQLVEMEMEEDVPHILH